MKALNDHPGVSGLLARRLIGASRNSVKGLAVVWREEAFRVEIMLFIVLAPLGFWLGQTGVARALLIGSLVLVLIVETLNTAVEVAINRISLDFHPLSGASKDLGSAAVLLSMLQVVLVWGLVIFG